jgi:hypothetical protein
VGERDDDAEVEEDDDDDDDEDDDGAVLDVAKGSMGDGAQSAAVRSSSSGKLKLETRRSTTPATPPLSGSEENDSILFFCLCGLSARRNNVKPH